MIEFNEYDLKEFNDTVEDIIYTLEKSTSNPILKLSIIECVRLNLINHDLIKLPEIFKKLGMKTSDLWNY